MSNFSYSKQVMSRSRPSKKSKSTINNVSAGLWRHVEEDDEMLRDEEMDFDIWSKLKDDICGVIKVNKSQHEHKAQNEEDDDLMDIEVIAMIIGYF